VEARTLGGQVVGAAEAECLRDERNWSDRDDFALRSMAQTRATSKALRLPLGFVVTMAGYDATPLEEMSAEAAPRPSPPKAEPPPPRRQKGEPAWIDEPMNYGRKHPERTWRYMADNHPDYLEWMRDKAERIPDETRKRAATMLIAGGIRKPEADAHRDPEADAAWDEAPF